MGCCHSIEDNSSAKRQALLQRTERERRYRQRIENDRRVYQLERQRIENDRKVNQLERQRIENDNRIQEEDKKRENIQREIENNIVLFQKWDGPETERSASGDYVFYHLLNIQAAIELIREHEQPLLLNYKIFENTKPVQRHVVGTFICKHKKKEICWRSGKICIEIYTNKSEFCVKVWNQKCRVCNRINIAELDKDIYIQKVQYFLRLHLGLRLPSKQDTAKTLTTPPHKEQLCCACAAGVCSEARRTCE